MKTIACIFGAGKVGNLALNILRTDYKDIFFCDNNVNKVGTIVSGIAVKSFDELKSLYIQEEPIDVYIAGYVQDIYDQCRKNSIDVAGIYSVNKNDIVSYRDYCVYDRKPFYNSGYAEYESKKRKRVNTNIAKFKNGEKMSACITEIAIELSNLCNYACIHAKCPAAHIKEKSIMPLTDIKAIIGQLCEIDFRGTICFQIYNEPMIDPRLFLIMEYIKQTLVANAEILVYTNGYYLTDSLVKDLQSGFADIIVATGYGKEEFERLINLNIEIPYYVLWGDLDDRLEWDADQKERENQIPCDSLFWQVPIWVNGDVGLCCLDYLQKVRYGNIKEKRLEDILDAWEVRKDMECLLCGNRKEVSYCASCDWKGRS